MTRYHITLTLLLFLVGASLIFVIEMLISESILDGNGVSVLSMLALLALLVAHLRRWRWSSEATLLCLICLIILSATPELLRSEFMVSVLVPAVIASLLFTPRWTLVAFSVTLVGLLLRVALSGQQLTSDTFGPTFSLVSLVQLGLVVGGLALGSTLARQSQRAAEMSAQQANAARAQAEAQAQELAAQVVAAQTARAETEAANEAIERQVRTIEQQQTVIQEMNVPILPVTSTSLLMPLVGALDATRLQLAQDQALTAIERSRARHLILDVTGVPIVDTQVAQGLVQIVLAARLLGAGVVLVGIRPEVAQAIVGLGITFDGVVTHQSLREGMSYVLSSSR